MAALIVTLLFIGSLTLVPERGAPRVEIGLCIVCDEYPLTDALLNVALFLPLGASLAALSVSRRRALRFALGLTVGIELLQLTVVAGRDPSLRDIAMNAIGASMGFSLATGWRRWLMPAIDEQRIFAWSAAAGIVIVLLVSSWAMTPSLPDTPYYGLWAPRLARMARFEGTVYSARAGGEPLPSGLVKDVVRLRGELRRDGPSLAALVRPGRTPAGRAPIVAIYDRDRRQIAILMQDGEAVRFRVRLQAASIGLRNPGIVLRHVFDPSAAAMRDTMRIAGRWRAGRMELAAGVPAAARGVAMAPALGWTLLLPFDLDLAGAMPGVSLLWVAALFLPLGYWIASAIALPRGERITIVALSMSLGLGGAPLLMGYPPAAPLVWLGATLGLLTGLWLSRYVKWRRA